MAADYLTVTAFKKTLSLSSESYADDDLALAITAASRAIDQECGRRFWLDSADQTRYYERTDDNIVRIDDLASFTSLRTDLYGQGTYDMVWTENIDFTFFPANAAADNWPFTMIERRMMWGKVTYPLPVGARRVQVIGKFGWPVVPSPVILATEMQAARWVKRIREAPFAVMGLGFDGTAVRIPKVDPDVRVALAGFKRDKIGLNMGFV